MSPDFSSAPPHFNPARGDEAEQITQLIFPDYYEIIQLRPVLRMRLASLAFHSDFVLRHLPENHPVLMIAMYRDRSILETLKDCLQPLDESVLVLTGLLPHFKLLKVNRELREQIKELPAILEKTLKDSFEKNAVAAGHVTPDNLSSIMMEVFGEMKHEMKIDEEMELIPKCFDFQSTPTTLDDIITNEHTKHESN